MNITLRIFMECLMAARYDGVKSRLIIKFYQTKSKFLLGLVRIL